MYDYSMAIVIYGSLINLLPKNQTGQKLVWPRVMYVIKNVRNKALTTSKFFEIIFPS